VRRSRIIGTGTEKYRSCVDFCLTSFTVLSSYCVCAWGPGRQSVDSLQHLSAAERECLMYLEETIDSLDVEEEDSGLSNDEPETSREADHDRLSNAVDQRGAGHYCDG